MDRFEAMRSFVQVVESGSFTRAALLLGRSKTTVSDQVSSLEANLGDIEFSLFASPSYLIRHGSPQQPGDLRQHQLIGYRNASANGVLEIALNRGDERVGVKMPMRLTVSDVVTTLQAGLAGLGIIYSSNFTVAQHLRTGSMVRILPDWQGRKMPLTLLSPSNRFRTARVQVFMDWWVQELLRKNLPAR